MILITGASGFIGSSLTWFFNKQNISNILLCDNLRKGNKWKNLRSLLFKDLISPENLFYYLNNSGIKIDFIFHLGACSNTKEQDMDFLLENNFNFSKKLYLWAEEKACPLVYASSAATYGKGENGFEENQAIKQLLPLNKYGYSKQLFDLWVEEKRTKELKHPFFCAGIKFFNVFGPNEYHKGSMSSVIYQAYQQIKQYNKVKLFKSYHQDYLNGEQKRDFVYIKDVCNILFGLYLNYKKYPKKATSFNLFNLGSGKANTFKDLVSYIFESLQKEVNIEYIEMEENIKVHYQYFTKAEMGFLPTFHSFDYLKKSVCDYVENYLEQDNSFLMYLNKDKYRYN